MPLARAGAHRRFRRRCFVDGMSERTKAILATTTIIACLALLGFMVWHKVDGASVAAIAAVTTLVAWLTRSPNTKDPPAGASLVPIASIGLAICSMLIGCGTQLKEALAEKTYKEDQLDCVDQYDTRERIEQCRDRVRERWGIAQRVRHDAGPPNDSGPPQDGGK